jgi:hypothetical protein
LFHPSSVQEGVFNNLGTARLQNFHRLAVYALGFRRDKARPWYIKLTEHVASWFRVLL